MASRPSKLWVAGSNPAGVAKALKLNNFSISRGLATESGESCCSMIGVMSAVKKNVIHQTLPRSRVAANVRKKTQATCLSIEKVTHSVTHSEGDSAIIAASMAGGKLSAGRRAGEISEAIYRHIGDCAALYPAAKS
jgi:hypothetical protein